MSIDQQAQVGQKRLTSSPNISQQQLCSQSQSQHQLLQPMSCKHSGPHLVKPAPCRRSSFPAAEPLKTSISKAQTGEGIGGAGGMAAASPRVPQPPPARESPARDSPARLHNLKQLQHLPDRGANSDAYPSSRHTPGLCSANSCPDLSFKLTDQQLSHVGDAFLEKRQQSAQKGQQGISISSTDKSDDDGDDVDGCDADLSHLLAAQAIVVQLLSPGTTPDTAWLHASAAVAASMAPAAVKIAEDALKSSSKASSQISSSHESSWQERHRHASKAAMEDAQASNKCAQLCLAVSQLQQDKSRLEQQLAVLEAKVQQLAQQQQSLAQQHTADVAGGSKLSMTGAALVGLPQQQQLLSDLLNQLAEAQADVSAAAAAAAAGGVQVEPQWLHGKICQLQQQLALADQHQQQLQAALLNISAVSKQGPSGMSRLVVTPLLPAPGHRQAVQEEVQQALSSSPAVPTPSCSSVSCSEGKTIGHETEYEPERWGPSVVGQPSWLMLSQQLQPSHTGQSRHVRFASQLPPLQLASTTLDTKLNCQQQHLAAPSAAARGSSCLPAAAASGAAASPLQTTTRRTPVPPQEAAPPSARQYTARRRYSSGSISEQLAVACHGSPGVSSTPGSRRSRLLMDKEKECYFSDPEPDTDGARGRRTAAGSAAGTSMTSRFRSDSFLQGPVPNTMADGQAILPALSPVPRPGAAVPLLPFEHLVSSPVGSNISSTRKGMDGCDCMTAGSRYVPVPPPTEELSGTGLIRHRPPVLRSSCSCLP